MRGTGLINQPSPAIQAIGFALEFLFLGPEGSVNLNPNRIMAIFVFLTFREFYLGYDYEIKPNGLLGQSYIKQACLGPEMTFVRNDHFWARTFHGLVFF